MKMRIVLSLIMLLAAASCGETENPGIGTSPSGGADDDPVTEAEPAPICIGEEVAKPCGIWVGPDQATADARAEAGAPPNGVVFSVGDTTCIDALVIADQRWPGRAVVRNAVEVWRAEGAR